MIKVDLSRSSIEKNIDQYQSKVLTLAKRMEIGDVKGSDFLGWKDYPVNYDKEEILKIKKTVKNLKKEGVQALVVIGIGGSYIGARAGIEMIQGLYPFSQNMEIIFLGESLSSTLLAQKLAYIETKEFAINVISKSGKTLEPAIAFRLLKKILENKVGKYNARKYIIATTDANQGQLLELAKENEYLTFVIPDNIGGRFSVLTAVGLFPLACVGIDIDQVLKGAKEAYKIYKSVNLKENPAYQYAVARHILNKKYPIELMVQYEPQMQSFSEWWKQLSGESEGKNNKGLFPASAIFSTDLHSLGQFIQEGSHVLFETMMIVEKPQMDLHIIHQNDDVDNLNYISELTVQKVNQVVGQATIDAHNYVAKVPIIILNFKDFSPKTFGHLVVFFQRAIALTSYLLDVNPFNQPGVEVYKQNILKILQEKRKRFKR